jgi:hypothetical protein
VLDINTGKPILDANGQPMKEKLPSFSNWAPRVSATYDLFGNGKTSIHASYSLYYQTKITLANALGGLSTQPALTWGPNQGSGICATAAGAPCWQDKNLDQLVQANELIGTPTTNANGFDLATGILNPAGNAVSQDAKLARTRVHHGRPARADPEPRGGRRLRVSQLRSRHGELSGRLSARIVAVPVVEHLRGAVLLHGSGDADPGADDDPQRRPPRRRTPPA